MSLRKTLFATAPDRSQPDLFAAPGGIEVRRQGRGVVFVAPALGYTSRVFGRDEEVAIAREGLALCAALDRREGR